MSIKIVGNGVWGNALYSVISQNCSNVSISKRGEKTDSDIIVLSVPTQSIRESLMHIHPEKVTTIINTAKGIEKSTHFLPYQIVESVLGKKIDYYTLIGPSFAQEVSQKMPTLVNLGFRIKSKNNEIVKNLFQTNLFRVRLTQGVEILELSAAFKNIYAIACGLAESLGFGTNTRVKLIVLAIEEMNNLFKSLKIKFNQDAIAGTIGDLILTCNSTESRNFSFGKLLTNHCVKQALSLIKTVEGYHSLASLDHLKKNSHAKLPLATFVSEAIKTDNPKTVRKNFENFVSSS